MKIIITQGNERFTFSGKSVLISLIIYTLFLIGAGCLWGWNAYEQEHDRAAAAYITAGAGADTKGKP